MSSTSSPPRAPAWLVELFASPQEADGILGDLAEEFSATLVCDGDQEARRRYKRQTWRTIRDLAVSPLRARPSSSATITASGLMLTAATGLAGLVMSWPVAALTNIVAGTIVRRYPISDYIPIAVFWDGVNLLGLLMTGVVVAIVARHLKFRPMSAALAMIAMMAVLFAVDRPIAMWLTARRSASSSRSRPHSCVGRVAFSCSAGLCSLGRPSRAWRHGLATLFHVECPLSRPIYSWPRDRLDLR